MPILIALLALAPALQEPDAPPSADPTQALFVQHCAQCHGLTGDGQGWTELDRPARSFLDGGFSYGNTRKAVVRSIRYGIPGTPMPAFPDDVLSVGQREALADYVIGLGPEGTVVEPGASVLRVQNRPVVVRGMLPPLDGGERHPRGLLVGFPSGTTFQYSADPVALLAIRQGEFVDRRDWGGRGGGALNPLGRVIDDARQAPAIFHDAQGQPLAQRLAATRIEGQSVVVATRLVPNEAKDARSANVELEEVLRVLETAAGPVPTRTVRIARDPLAAQVAGLTPLPKGARVRAAFRGAGGITYHAYDVAPNLVRVQPKDGAPDVFHLVHTATWSPALERAVLRLEATR